MSTGVLLVVYMSCACLYVGVKMVVVRGVTCGCFGNSEGRVELVGLGLAVQRKERRRGLMSFVGLVCRHATGWFGFSCVAK